MDTGVGHRGSCVVIFESGHVRWMEVGGVISGFVSMVMLEFVPSKQVCLLCCKK